MRFLITFFFIAVAYGDAYQPLKAKEKKEIISKVQSYFNGLKNLKAGFVQQKVDHTGQLQSSDKGTLYLKRNKDKMAYMRIDYKTIPQRMIAKNRRLYITDLTTNDTEDYSLSDIPSLYILNARVSLNDDCDVTEVLKNKELYQVVTKPHSTFGGQEVELRLIFTRKPFFMFAGWILRDEHNTMTVVSFMKDEVRINTKMSESLFNISTK